MHPQLLCHPSNRSRPKLILPSDLLEQLHLRSPFHSAPLFFLNSKQRLAFLQLQGWGQIKLSKGANLEYRNHTVVIVDEPARDRFYLLCLETERSVPQLIRTWRRHSWIEFVFWT